MSSGEYFDILKSAENDAERNRLKHVVSSGYNLSRRQASSMYKISRMKERATAVTEACEKAKEITSMHKYFARVEQRAFFNSVGADCDVYLNGSGSEDDSGEESEVEEDDLSDSEECQESVEEKVLGPNSEQGEEIGSIPTLRECLSSSKHCTSEGQDGKDNGSESGELNNSSTSSEKKMPEIDVNSVIVLDILREVNMNCLLL